MGINLACAMQLLIVAAGSFLFSVQFRYKVLPYGHSVDDLSQGSPMLWPHSLC